MVKPQPNRVVLDESRPVTYYKNDFWREENARYSEVHYRLDKCARIVNRIAGERECNLLDVGCGPATLARLLRPNIHYYGIDIAIQEPAANLAEVDILDSPIGFDDLRFEIVVAQGLFEYLGEHQSEKLAEIARVLRPRGTFVTSYVNFGHRQPTVYWPYSNVQTIDEFRSSLSKDFVVRNWFATSHNWHHNEPNRRFIRLANMHLNLRIPVLTSKLAVEYFFVCTPRSS